MQALGYDPYKNMTEEFRAEIDAVVEDTDIVCAMKYDDDMIRIEYHL